MYQDYNKQLNNVINLVNKFIEEKPRFTILTGQNASGKSLSSVSL